MTHIVTADNEGSFYCRAVSGELNYKKGQYVCGRGCPCFVKCGGGEFICRYKEEEGEPLLFPRVEGLDQQLYKAYAFAAAAHRGQVRKGTNVPYFTHIITTMNYAMELTEDREVLTAAILHDTVEDTPVTIDEIRQGFGERVAFLVEAETENKRHDRPAEDTWEIRKQESLLRLRDMPREVKVITLADKTANAESLVRERRLRQEVCWDKFNQKDKLKQEWYFRESANMLKELSNTSVMEQYLAYIDEIFVTV